MIEELRQRLQALQKNTSIDGDAGVLPLGVEAVDAVLGGGLSGGALHEIASSSEAHLPAASAFVLGLASLSATPGRRRTIWIAEDMSLAESGVPYGGGLDAFALAPGRLVTVAVAHRRDLMWAMEEALRCRAVGAVIGEVRHGALDAVAVRRLSLAASESGALGLLLRARPAHDASTAATRWIVGTSRSIEKNSGFGAPCFATALVRNRRGPAGAWILEWRETDERFALATHAQPVAAPLRHRPRQKVA